MALQQIVSPEETEQQPQPLNVWQIQGEENVAALLEDEQLNNIGAAAVQGFMDDKVSRSEWEKRNEEANKLALQIVEEKTFPWKNASNVKFPLITIAALQFSARAYPALCKGPNIAKYRVNGEDKDGKKSARAQRVSKHMSYQLLEQDEDWEEEFDQSLIILPITGCVFKKSYWDAIDKKNVSRLVLAEDLYVNYHAKKLETCERKTELFTLSTREVREKQLRGFFRDIELLGEGEGEEKLSDVRQGLTRPPIDITTPSEFLEQHTFLDLDEDGYAEPYVITVHRASQKVVRIVSRFAKVITEQTLQADDLVDRKKLIEMQIGEILAQVPPPTGQEDEQALQAMEQIAQQIRQLKQQISQLEQQLQQLAQDNEQNPKVLKIHPQEHYTKYSFIPSPDKGFYDLGLGVLLGPVNETVNTIINQLIDSGTLQNGNQGFIGKGARMSGGTIALEPYEWRSIPVAGGQLRDNIVPLPVNDPSKVLFDLLGLLITYGEKISSVTDTMTGGNPGQNTPAYNYQGMLEQGLQVFNGIFKRVYRGFRKELRKMYTLNALYLNPMDYFETMDGRFQILQQDYQGDEKDLYPAADPNAFSNMVALAKAQFLAERAQMVPHYNTVEIEKLILAANEIADIQSVFPTDEQGQPTIPAPPNAELELKVQEETRRAIESKGRMDIAVAEAESRFDVDESIVLLNKAKAQKLGDDIDIAWFEAIQEEQAGRRETLKIILEESRAIVEATNKRLDDKSSH